MKKLICKVKELIQKVKNFYKKRAILGYYDRIIDEADKLFLQTGQRHYVFLSGIDLYIVPNKKALEIKNKEKCSWKNIKDSAMYYTEDKKEKAMSKKDVKLRKIYYVREIHKLG